MIDSGHTGFYFKVLEEGIAEKGAELIFKERDPRSVSVSFPNHTYHHDRKNCGAIEKTLAVPALSAS